MRMKSAREQRSPTISHDSGLEIYRLEIGIPLDLTPDLKQASLPPGYSVRVYKQQLDDFCDRSDSVAIALAYPSRYGTLDGCPLERVNSTLASAKHNLRLAHTTNERENRIRLGVEPEPLTEGEQEVRIDYNDAIPLRFLSAIPEGLRTGNCYLEIEVDFPERYESVIVNDRQIFESSYEHYLRCKYEGAGRQNVAVCDGIPLVSSRIVYRVDVSEEHGLVSRIVLGGGKVTGKRTLRVPTGFFAFGERSKPNTFELEALEGMPVITGSARFGYKLRDWRFSLKVELRGNSVADLDFWDDGGSSGSYDGRVEALNRFVGTNYDNPLKHLHDVGFRLAGERALEAMLTTSDRIQERAISIEQRYDELMKRLGKLAS